MSEKDLTSFQDSEPDLLAIEKNLSVYEWYAEILQLSNILTSLILHILIYIFF